MFRTEGFFESDLERVEAQHQASRSQQAYALLKAWRLREGLEAYVIKLQKALQDVGLPELATGLNNPQ